MMSLHSGIGAAPFGLVVGIVSILPWALDSLSRLKPVPSLSRPQSMRLRHVFGLPPPSCLEENRHWERGHLARPVRQLLCAVVVLRTMDVSCLVPLCDA